MKKFGIIIVLGMSLLLMSCKKNEIEHMPEIDEDKISQEREEVNAMQGEIIASDGNVIYMLGDNIVYQIDLENKELKVNCNDLLCDHEGINCSAKLPISYSGFYSLRRNGDKVYVLGDQIYEIGNNSKKEIGRGGYGSRDNKIIFDKYLAFFEKDDVVVVEDLETNKEVQRFEGITGYTQGNFYYDGYLYYITAELQLIRLNIETGKAETLEEKGATRACIYDGSIYYIRVSESTDTNHLMRLNPINLEKEEVLEGVFYYNMLGEKIYYSTYPGRKLYCSDLNGENRIELSSNKKFNMGWIWAFRNSNTVLLAGEDCYTFYVLDEKQKLDYENVIIRPQ